jgi:hypothetical protein
MRTPRDRNIVKKVLCGNVYGSHIPRCILNRDTVAVTEKMSQEIRRDRKGVTRVLIL